MLSLVQAETFIEESRCAMGENDSRNDVKKICFLETKRKVIEKVATFLESTKTVQNYNLSKEELKSYSAALIQVETLEEKWGLEDNNVIFTIRLKADVDTSGQANADTSPIEKQLAKIQNDPSAQQQIKQQQSRLQELEQQVVELQKQLGSVEATKAAKLRKDRNLVFNQIDALQQKKIAITEKIKATAKNVAELIELGMVDSEVLSLVGQPRAKNYSEDQWNYGLVSILFTNGVVGCVVKNDCRRDWSDCSGYRSYGTSCVIK